MKRICRELQERLAEEGAQAVRDDVAAQRHLEECPDCFRVLEGLARLDAVLGSVAPIDAPELAVSELLERVRSEGSAPAIEPLRRPRVPRSVLWGLASAAALVLAVGGLVPSLLRARVAVRPEPALDSYRSNRPGASPPTTLAAEPERSPERKENRQGGTWDYAGSEEVDELRALGYVEGSGSRAAPATAGEDEVGQKTLSVDGKLEAPSGPRQQKAGGGKADADDKRQEQVVIDGSGVEGGVAGGVVGGLADEESGQEQAGRFAGTSKAPRLIRRVEPSYPDAARSAGVQGVVIVEVRITASGRIDEARVLRSVPLLDAAALDAVRQWVYAPTVVNGKAVPVYLTVTVPFRLPEPAKTPGSSDNLPNEPARAFLAERSATEDVEFQAPGGYWANTYVPGDPALRLLQARLAAWDRSALQAQGVPLRLHDAAAQPSQPFDAPRDAALAVYLHADRRGLEGPGRMLVQVGLKGAARAGGRRPDMSVALVLDLRGEVAVETASGMRALALALSRAREAGDRFSLVVAGRPGGVAVAPAEFKHGPLAVALDRLLVDASSGAGLGLADAVAAAYREVSRCDDPEAPLGSSAVVLVTSQALEEPGTLGNLAHQGAVAGIPLSVIALGGGVSLGEIDRLALAGQGRRRVLEAASDAARVVDAELGAAGGAVARAVRLRIRLAPGVRLVEVVGSRRLDEAQAERVREAERSIDLDLSRKLGIDSDRGDDEDGIQILIPSFQAGDAHAILLDVVAPGPGPIADLGVRYKDLLSLRNGVARAGLTLTRGATAPGPLERNVLANLLAFRVSRALACAGDALAAGEVRGASAAIEDARALLAGLGALVPGLAGDPALVRDAAMLREYAGLLASGALGASERPRVADSLRYAARLKLLPRPAPLAVAAL
jgi:Ca-activated chloride channel family protein